MNSLLLRPADTNRGKLRAGRWLRSVVAFALSPHGTWRTLRPLRLLTVLCLLSAVLVPLSFGEGGGTTRSASLPAQHAPVARGLFKIKGKAAVVVDQTKAAKAWRAKAVTWPVGTLTAGGLAQPSQTTLPVTVSAIHGAGAIPEVTIKGLARTASKAAGVAGPLFVVSGSPGSASLHLSYKPYADAFGGNWAARLQLVSVPACILTTPKRSACHSEVPLTASSNDLETATLSAQLHFGAEVTADVRPAGLQPAEPKSNPGTYVLAAVSAPASGAGTFASSANLAPSGSWSAAGNSGAFTYSYPISTPPAPSSLVPTVALSYNSQSVDGLTSATNNQPSWIGDGWGYSPGYVSRSYATCSQDPEGATAGSGDLCWDGQIVQLSLGSESGDLINDPTVPSGWALSGNPGDMVQYLTGASNGTEDGGYWKVTTTDGTQYYFGLNELPGWTSGDPTTNSAWTVPVYGAHSGDPCYSASGFAASSCSQAWQWNLDYEVDSKGNAIEYSYDTASNDYGANGSTTGVPYVRDGWLDHISYGLQSSAPFAQAPDEISFTTGDRCSASSPSSCDPIASNSQNWPDVPYDLNCNAGATCTNNTPTFWSEVALSTITTKVWTGSAYSAVDSYALTHTYPTAGDGENAVLWLSSITQTGLDGGSVTLPPVSFAGQDLVNRVNTGDGWPLITRYRVSGVTTEAGEVIAVSYSSPACTPSQTASITPSQNTDLCFPVYWVPPGQPSPVLDWFNKYVVNSVVEEDETGDNPPVTTSYTYVGNPAWHYDDNEVVLPADRTYGQWRGYPQVNVAVGNPSDVTPELTDTIYFQGMNGDLLPGGSVRNSTVSLSSAVTVAGATMTVPDYDELSGEPREVLTYDGVGGAVDNAVVTDFWVSPNRAVRNRLPLPPLTANFALASATYTTKAITSSGSTTWRTSETQTGYNTTTGMPVEVDNQGDLSVTGERTCTTTSYVPATSSSNLVDLPAEVQDDNGACATGGSSSDGLAAPTVTTASQVLSDTRTYYDTAAPTAWPPTVPAWPQASATAGNPTLAESANGLQGSALQYQITSATSYDSYGRAIGAWDGLGNKTVTAYLPVTGLATTVTDTNPKGQATTTTLDPANDNTLTSTDPNGNKTTNTYDALGRITATWNPGEPTSSAANTTESYSIPGGTTAASVTSQALGYGGYDTTTVDIYDSLLRPVQTQTSVDGGGRTLTNTFYDTRGLAWKTNAAYYETGNPSSTLVDVPDSSVPDQDEITFDGAGRPTLDASYANASLVSSTQTVYGGDRTTTIPPKGGVAQTTVVNGLGDTTEVDQYTAAPTTNLFGDGGAVGGPHTTTTYSNNAADQLTGLIDAIGASWSFSYNMLGQKVTQTDPDAGTSTYTYNADGSVLTTTDANGNSLTYGYDVLGRQTGLYNGPTVSSPALSATTYDTATDGIGQPATETSYNGSDAYTQTFTGYSPLGKPTGETVTIPSSQGALAGTYSYLYTYDAATGLPRATVYPAGGGLAKETVVEGYSVSGNETTLQGTAPYLSGATYTPLNEPQTLTLADSLSTGNTFDSHTNNLTQTETEYDGSTLDDTTYKYDLYGNITSSDATQPSVAGSTEDQCYDYNSLDELTAAWSATDNCAADLGQAGATNATVGGPAPYWETWTFDADGDRLTEVNHATSGTGAKTSTGYSYPTVSNNGQTAPGPQPHTLSAITTTGPQGTTSTSYGYDADGNLTTSTSSAGAQHLTWNSLNQLSSDTTGAGTTKYIYDASGALLEQADPTTTVLYLPGEQLTLNSTTNTVSGLRQYDLPSGETATRTGTGVYAFSYQLSDPHGTENATINLAGSTPVLTARYFDPYGNVVGAAPTWPDNRTFLDDPTDQTTGLTSIGVRQYSAMLGRFVSDDPVLETDDPLQLNGYGYGAGNPNTDVDSTGERACAGNGDDCAPVVDNPASAPSSSSATPSAGIHEGTAHITGGSGPRSSAGKTAAPGKPEKTSSAPSLPKTARDVLGILGSAIGVSPPGVALGIASKVSGHALGYCINGDGVTPGLAGTASVCYVATPSGQSGLAETLGVGTGNGDGADITGGLLFSNAHKLSDLNQTFEYASASAGTDDVATVTGSVGVNHAGRVIYTTYAGAGTFSPGNVDAGGESLLPDLPISVEAGFSYTFTQPSGG